ncbi:hypothetical protein PAXRUDRAFT_21323, partial [Paxillus rubicundulus Ve08.2h10]
LTPHTLNTTRRPADPQTRRLQITISGNCSSHPTKAHRLTPHTLNTTRRPADPHTSAPVHRKLPYRVTTQA